MGCSQKKLSTDGTEILKEILLIKNRKIIPSSIPDTFFLLLAYSVLILKHTTFSQFLIHPHVHSSITNQTLPLHGSCLSWPSAAPTSWRPTRSWTCRSSCRPAPASWRPSAAAGSWWRRAGAALAPSSRPDRPSAADSERRRRSAIRLTGKHGHGKWTD